MDNDELSVVVTSVLEADVDASAKRIKAQLPEISSKISDTIKVGVVIDESNVKTQATKIASEIKKSSNNATYDVKLRVEQGAISSLKNDLRDNLKVSNDLINAMTLDLSKMNVQIDRVRASWVKAEDTQERLLQLTIDGVDQEGRNVDLIQRYNEEGELVVQTQKNITLELGKQRAEAERANKSRLEYLAKEQISLDKIKSSYEGKTSVKPVTDESHLNELSAKYTEIQNQIKAYQEASGALSTQQKLEIEQSIAGLEQLTKEYQNAEYVATQLRTKTAKEVNFAESEKLTEYENKLKNLGIYTDGFKQSIDSLRTQLNTAFDSKSITNYLNAFGRLDAQVNVFKSQLAGLDSLITKQIASEKKIANLQVQLTRAEPGSAKYTGLDEQLNIELRHREEITAEIRKQLAINPELINYSKKNNDLLREQAVSASKVTTANEVLAESAHKVDEEMSILSDATQEVENKFSRLTNPTETVRLNVERLRTAFDALRSANTEQEKVDAYNKLKVAIDNCNTEIDKFNRNSTKDYLLTDKLKETESEFESLGKKWSSLFNSKDLSREYNELLSRIRAAANDPSFDNNAYKRLIEDIRVFRKEVVALGKDHQTLGDILKNNIAKVSQWLTATTLIFRAFRLFKDAINTIKELDSAMVEVKKVTDESKISYDNLYYSANKTAKELGATTKEVINQTAEWARLGYTLDEASELAKNSAIFSTISEDMSLEQATDGLVSIIKAYDIDVENTLDGIISKINAVGNAYAVSNSDLVETLTRSSSAMSAANTTFEETIALATAAIEITRNAEQAGNALRTISMRIRGYDEATEEYSEDVAILTGKIADLTKTASTPGGISLFEKNDPDTYRSIYDILQDIANIWDELEDKNRAQLVEALFGKQRGQVGTAILSNFESASKSMDTMANSFGSATAEMENAMDSVEKKLNALKETWVGVAQSIINTGGLKTTIDGLTKLSEAVGFLIKNLGLLGTTITVVLINKLVKSVRETKSAIDLAKTTISSLNFQDVSNDVQSAANALQGLTQSQGQAVIASSKLASAHADEIMASAQLRKNYLTSASALLSWVGVAATVISAIVTISKNIKQANEQRRNEDISTAKSAAESSQSVYDLVIKYQELTEVVKTDTSVKEELINTENELISKLNIEGNAVDNLKDKYAGLNSEAIKSLKDYELSLAGGRNAAEENLIDAGKSLYGINISWNKAENDKAQKAWSALANAGYVNKTKSSPRTLYTSLSESGEFDPSTVEGVTNAYNRLGDMIRIVNEEAGSDNAIFQQLWELYEKVTPAINSYSTAVSDLNNNLASQATLSALQGKSLPKTVEEFNALRKEIMDTALNSDAFKTEDGISKFIGDESTIKSVIDTYLKSLPEFTNFFAQVDESTNVYVADLRNLKDVLDEYKNMTSLVTTAETEMASGTGLSVDTIKELSQVTDDYLDYLYEEDGVIKLNVEAFRELAASKLQAEQLELTKEIDSINEQTEALRAENELLERQIELKLLQAGTEADPDGSGVSELTNKIRENNSVIEENSNKISENQSKLGLYDAIYNQVIQSAEDAYSAMTSKQFGSVNELVSLQEAIGDSYTVTVEKAMELANAYPEILNSATVSADGLITLNNEVVNNFLQGKQQEITAAIDAQIAELEGEQAILQAQLDSVAQEVSIRTDANGQIISLDQQAAEQRIGIYDAVYEAARQAGIDEQTANQMALAAMSGDWDAFDTVAENAVYGLDDSAAEAFSSVMNNFATMSKNMAENVDKLITKFNNLAQAVKNSSSGTQTNIQGVNIHGGNVSGMGKTANEGGISSQFDALKSQLMTEDDVGGGNYKDNLKDVIDDAEDTSDAVERFKEKYQEISDKLSKVNATITTLQGIKNSAMEGILASPNTPGGAGGGGSSKQLEEYTADIDKYREALNKLDQAKLQAANIESQIENTEDYTQKITLIRELTSAYQEEQLAIQDLIAQRSNDISSGVEQLQNLGFNVEYDAEANSLWIENLAHLNEITANSVGNYGSIQEATNELRKDTEDLIDTIIDLNEENQQSAEEFQNVADSISGADGKVQQYLNSIVEQANASVDSIQNAFKTLVDAIKEYNDTGYITVDTLQSVIGMGVQYLSLLTDENGSLVLNEQRIQAIVKARTQQLGVESALQYIEALATAKLKGNETELMNLIQVTNSATKATWAFVYAKLAEIGLSDEELAGAKANIESLEAMTESALASVDQTFTYAAATAGDKTDDLTKKMEEDANKAQKAAIDAAKKAAEETLDSLEDMKDGVDKILDLTMDMIKQKVEDEIDALEDMKDTYGELIDMRKESLKAAKDESDYQKGLTSKFKQMAKIQERINALSLDDSRSAQAEKVKLEEQLAELQQDLADEQSEHAIEAQEEALDRMEEAYEKEKDNEIKKLEDSISSTQKLYDMAIEHISNNWQNLYSELTDWNYNYGSSLTKDISEAWDKCTVAAQKYGSYLGALQGLQSDIARQEAIITNLSEQSSALSSSSSSSSSESLSGGSDGLGMAAALASSGLSKKVSNTEAQAKDTEEEINRIIQEMNENSQKWSQATTSEERHSLSNRNVELSNELATYGITAVRGDDGVWYIDGLDGEKLYDKYLGVYHEGGIVGDGSLRENEAFAKLQKGEWVLSTKMVDDLTKQMGRIDLLTKCFDKFTTFVNGFNKIDNLTPRTISNISNITNRPCEITIGDTVIYGADKNTINKHVEVTRNFVNEILSKVGMKK